MKKVLLAGTAIVGAAFVASPAHADGLKLDLGGYFRGYAVYAENDEPAGTSLQKFDFKKDTEVSFGGETTTDSGLTVGVHSELKMGGTDNTVNSIATGAPVTAAFATAPGIAYSGMNASASNSQTDEAYAYFSGGWGRVNFGQEDGAAYLLQVAAPSADSNVDGLRVSVQSFDGALWITAGGSRTKIQLDTLGYDNADFRQVDRITYLTPKFNGFQAGLSYAPKAVTAGWNFSSASALSDLGSATSADYENLWELSARWDGEFQGFGISLGGGYADAGTQKDNTTATAMGSDDMQTWNGGLNVAFQGFSLGVAYKNTNTSVKTSGDVITWVVGGGWDNGPYHVGASWLNQNIDNNAWGLGLTDNVKLNRYTVGGGYTFGPGMTFRGAVAMLDVNNGTDAKAEPNQYQVTVGTDINF
jgi:predicted porin